jgi:hypothetical protein
VERVGARELPVALARTSLSLLAGTELVRSLHAVSALLGDSETLWAAWNEPDPVAGIPALSWEQSLATYRNLEYQALFREALDRLTRHRPELEGYLARRERPFPLLFPRGIGPTLRQAEDSYALLRAGLAEEDLADDERVLRRLVDRAKGRRVEWAEAGAVLREAAARDGRLVRGDVHFRVQVIKRDYLDIREALHRLAFKHLPKLTRQDIPYPAGFRLRAVAISLLAGVTLLENARTIQRQIATIPEVRPLLNQADLALGVPRNFWSTLERELYRVEYRQFLEAGIRLMEAARPPPYGPDPDDPLLAWVSGELASTVVGVELRQGGAPRQIARALQYHLGQLGTAGASIPRGAQLQLSRGFGNAIGVVEFRKGKLHGQPQWTQFLRERLVPGDILLDRTPFRLTDTFIPGHFGHVALYVGSERELADLGLLRHPLVRGYRPLLAQGRSIVEALRDGTQLNSVEHFLNVDDVAILRPKPEAIPRGDVLQAIKLAFGHVGKRYDFGFDANTWDAIVCSELVFQSYVNVPWTAARVLSSHTVSPDDIAVFAGADPSRPFELVSLVHDGRLVHDPRTGLVNEAVYARLLGARYRTIGRTSP